MTGPDTSKTTGDATPLGSGSPNSSAYEKELLLNWPAEELLRANLEALGERDKSNADIIAATGGADRARMVVAHDGSVTFRFDGREDRRRSWLGHTSVPLIAAAANIKRTNLTGGNIVMNGIGHGRDAQLILERISSHQALLAIESDPLITNLVFRLRDFGPFLRRGQLVILLGTDPNTLLQEFYAEHTGYNAVSQVIAWPWLDDQQNQQFAAQVTLAMEQVTQKSLVAVDVLLGQQQESDEAGSVAEIVSRFNSPGFEGLRAANCTNAYTAVDYCTSRDALAGLAQLGFSTDWLILNQPDNISHQAQLQRLDRLKPHLIVLVDTVRRDIVPPLPKSALCVTILRDPAAPPAGGEDEDMPPPIGPHDFIFAGHPDQIEEYKKAGILSDRLIYLPPGANCDLFRPVEVTEAYRQRYAADVALVADRFSTDPETYQVRLPSHQTLLNTVIKEIQQAPHKYHRQNARQYLLRAQHCGVELREDDLRKYFSELVEKFLGESAVLDAYANALKNEGFDLRIWGWSNLPDKQTDEKPPYWPESPAHELIAGTISHGTELNKLYNTSKVHLYFPGASGSRLHLLDGIAAGAFFLIKEHPTDRLGGSIGKMFQLGRELITFETPKDLLRKVRYFLSHEQERRQIATAARQKLLAAHSYKQRMSEMMEMIAARMDHAP